MTIASDNLARVCEAIRRVHDGPMPDGDPDSLPYLLYAGGGDFRPMLSLHGSPIEALEHYAKHAGHAMTPPFKAVVALRTCEAVAGELDVELTPPTPEQYLAEVLDAIDADDDLWDDVPVFDPDRPILLIEQNVGGSSPPYWVTTHVSIGDALIYNRDQEYADDWGIYEIHHLLARREIPAREWSEVQTATVIVDPVYEARKADTLWLLDQLPKVDGKRPTVDLDDDVISVYFDDVRLSRPFDDEHGGTDPYVVTFTAEPAERRSYFDSIHAYLDHIGWGDDDERQELADFLDEVMSSLDALAYRAAANAISSL